MSKKDFRKKVVHKLIIETEELDPINGRLRFIRNREDLGVDFLSNEI